MSSILEWATVDYIVDGWSPWLNWQFMDSGDNCSTFRYCLDTEKVGKRSLENITIFYVSLVLRLMQSWADWNCDGWNKSTTSISHFFCFTWENTQVCANSMIQFLFLQCFNTFLAGAYAISDSHKVMVIHSLYSSFPPAAPSYVAIKQS